jgi:hypothetical protein
MPYAVGSFPGLVMLDYNAPSADPVCDDGSQESTCRLK